MEFAHPLALELLGLKATSRVYHRREPHSLATVAATASPGRANVITVAMLLAALEAGTDRYTWRRPTEDQIAYFRQLQSWEYAFSDVEMLILAAETPGLNDSGTPAADPDPAAHLERNATVAADGSGQDTAAWWGDPGFRVNPTSIRRAVTVPRCVSKGDHP